MSTDAMIKAAEFRADTPTIAVPRRRRQMPWTFLVTRLFVESDHGHGALERPACYHP